VPLDFIAEHGKLSEAIRAQLAGQRPVAVVIDTLNRALNGSENDPKDMARFLRAVDAIRESFGCAAITVHHCGLDGARPRGHTSLTGATDAQIAVERNEADDVIATVEYMKDDDAGTVIASRLERVTLGTDRAGKPITSLVAIPALFSTDTLTGAGKSARRLTANQRRFLDILRDAVAEAPADLNGVGNVPAGAEAVTRDMLKRYCVAKGWMEEADSNRARAKFSDMVNAIAGKRLIGVTDKHIWVAR